MPPSSKDLVRGLFRLEDVPRVPFIPWVCTLAARLEQVEIEDMLSDGGVLAVSLGNAQKLFGYDAICNVFDSSLEAEALGCEIAWDGDGGPPRVVGHPLAQGVRPDEISISGMEGRGRIPAVIEATRRLKIVMGQQVAIFGVITGPVALAGHLAGDGFAGAVESSSQDAARVVALAGSACLNLARKYCELGVDALVVADETLGLIAPERLQIAAGPLKSIWNVARFYNVRTLLLSRGCTGEHALPILRLGADGVVVSGDFDQGPLAQAAIEDKRCYGRGAPVPVSAWQGGDPGALASVAAYMPGRQRGFFLSTDWEVPYSAAVDAVHGVMATIREERR